MGIILGMTGELTFFFGSVTFDLMRTVSGVFG